MMTDLRLARLRARYRLPAEDAAARRRLDSLLRVLVDDALEASVARSGIAPSEEICVRNVRALTNLGLSSSDPVLTAAWSVAIAESIRRTVDAGGPNVIRYASRAHALHDMLTCIAAGDLRRAWAWRRLGIWTIGDAPPREASIEEAIRSLVARPKSIVGVVAASADSGALMDLVTLIPVSGWRVLARAALRAAGSSDGLADRLLTGAPEAETDASATSNRAHRADDVESRSHRRATVHLSEAAERAPDDPARTIAERSRIARLLSSRNWMGLEPSVRRALSALAVLEVEPSCLLRSRDPVFEVVDRLVRLSDPRSSVETSHFEENRPSAREDIAHPTRDGSDAERAPSHDRSHLDHTHLPAAEREAAAHEPRYGRQADMELAEVPVPPQPAPARSSWGGLPFLLHVVGELAVPIEITENKVFSARTVRWVLHRIAMHLLGLAEADPAALAFAGLPPKGPSPSAEQTDPSSSEQTALEALALQVAERFSDRLIEDGGAAPEPALRMVRRVARREARFVASPGWIDVVLSLDDVAVEVRRAGLDLDPGWIPWLGTVVRFVYE
ncbi:MAG: hypothetical protein GEU90_09095 [Gemmatimonas sp.]|nr:hypothetical protein [Gemmatimonas sp.]